MASKPAAAKKSPKAKPAARGVKPAARRAKPTPASDRGGELVIVESPAKARTIARFLGSGFNVLSSMGHIADLPRKGMAVDIEHGFEPEYVVGPEKKKTVAELRRAAAGAKRVWLATDEDREGEAIAWHLARLLRLPDGVAGRIVFHEITEGAIREALASPRAVDQHLVDAQQARRVLDRLVGYELSPVLWKKVRSGLSAGRVQSVAVRLVVEREREIDRFRPEVSFKTTGEFEAETGAARVSAKLDTDFADEAAAREFLARATGADFAVAAVEKKPAKRSPRPPFTTSTLQQEASQKLGLSVRQTMRLAQRLYEAGHITYMRTDSVTLAEVALAEAAEVVTRQFGREYAHRRQFKTKTRSAQEAHEAIRPTSFRREQVEGERSEQKLYELIWRRALASQMADARVERTTVTIVGRRKAGGELAERFLAKGEVILFKGFLAAYDAGSDEDEESRELPPLEQGHVLRPVEITARESFARPPARFTEASLVKRLEELGIGRPSTYAPTIATVQERGYVDKRSQEGRERQYRVLTLAGGRVAAETRTETIGTEKAKLFPTDVAGLVTDFLVGQFREVVDYDFTARVEEELDEVAAGSKDWRQMVGEFYQPFHADVEKAGALTRAEVARSRELGTDPATGRPVSARLGPYGPFVQLGTKDDEEKPRFASLRPGQRLDSVTLEEALELFKLPRKVGRTPEGEEIIASFGRFGPYLRYGKSYVSLKEHDPVKITAAEAEALVTAARERAARQLVREFPEEGIRVLVGRYGPYVSDGKKNAKVPKNADPAKLSLEECRELLKSAGRRKRTARRPRGR
ncbi:MAG: type I DNA topoisomerase [bacterium]